MIAPALRRSLESTLEPKRRSGVSFQASATSSSANLAPFCDESGLAESND